MIRGVLFVVAVASVLTILRSARRSECEANAAGKQLLRKLFKKKALSSQGRRSHSDTALELKTKAFKPSGEVTDSSLDVEPQQTWEQNEEFLNHVDSHFEQSDSEPITRDQFKIMVETFPDVAKHAEDIFAQLDADNNGAISYEEWCTWLYKKFKPDFMNIFVEVDSTHGNDGKLDQLQLMIAIELMIAELNDEELKDDEAVIKRDVLSSSEEFDSDSDGEFDIEEFLALMKEMLIPAVGDALIDEYEAEEQTPPQSEEKAVKAKC
eukprot:TRINITY_DN3190_c2_g1_i1.p1 TRINITY_DN3190_c2_g1~~TRINITY_DN3190_c2_g1_i1.p1  ORF type:complete len:266 (+),score=60.10 TRINITY_DN3190_c2_g1_i1:91-888(+)